MNTLGFWLPGPHLRTKNVRHFQIVLKYDIASMELRCFRTGQPFWGHMQTVQTSSEARLAASDQGLCCLLQDFYPKL